MQNPKYEVQIISDYGLQTSDLNWLPLLHKVAIC
jgi:hypothetical protein